MNELKKLMGGVYPTKRMLKEYKESWIDKLKYKTVTLQRFIERSRQIMDNALKETSRTFFKS